MNRGRSKWPRMFFGPVALVGLTLVVSRLLVFFAVPQRESLGPYPTWVREYKLAEQAGLCFYEVHEREAHRRFEERKAGGQEVQAEGTHSIEYPPLAMTALLLPATVLPPQGDEPTLTPDSLARYVFAFRLEMLAFDLCAFVILALLTLRLFPRESAGSARSDCSSI